MEVFEYKVVPAPKKGKPVKGVRGAEAKFARTVSDLMNEMGAEGWEYQRADTLPSEARSGLWGRKVVDHHLLVFRRVRQDASAAKPPLPSLSSRPTTVPNDPQLATPEVDPDSPLGALVAQAKRNN